MIYMFSVPRCLYANASINLILFLFSSFASFSQTRVEVFKAGTAREFISASPNASMFNVFEQTPVSHFSGAPQISVPLHKIQYKELSVDLSLMYHSTMGNKPDVMPGPVGNGWLLTCGGTITRISKGVRSADIAESPSVPTDYNPTEPSDWSSQATMNKHIKDLTVFPGPECRYDEYAYNFLGMTGKFYKDHNDIPHFKTDQGESLKLETVFQSGKQIPLPNEPQGPYTNYSTHSINYREYTIQEDYIEKFILTDSRGIKYVFGGDDDAIELSKPGIGASKSYQNQNTIPTTWYLTSIESPNGYAINFEYRRGKFYVTSEAFCEGMIMQHSEIPSGLFTQPFARGIRSTAIHPSYLERITTPNGYIQFTWSLASAQLGYTYNPSPDVSNPEWPMYFLGYPEVQDAYMTNRFGDKLDEIEVNINGQLRKSIGFNYTTNTSTRLKLLSVKIADVLNTDKGHQLWKFEYNPTPLPEYLSFKTDKYGYYNGRNTYITSDNVNYYINFFRDPTSVNNYIASREPDTLYSKAEILTKVVSPTQGYTVYEYENHDYGRKATFWPIGLTENSQSASKITGGLRIRKIKTYDADGHKAGEKKYFYALNFAAGGRKSSGVLNYEPVYYETFDGEVQAPANKTDAAFYYEGHLKYDRWNVNGLYPASYYKGSHVKYSEVAEVDLDGSYTVYKYNNYDNGFHDKPAERMVCDNANVATFYREDDVNNMELERGKLKSKDLYTNANQIVRKTEYFYDTAVSRFANNVRVLKGIANPIYSANFPSVRYVATLQYTYYPYLKQKRQTDYSAGGALVEDEYYTVDVTNRLVKEEKITLNNNKKKSVVYRYTEDMIAGGQTVPYLAMKDKHIIGTLVESEERLDNTSLYTSSTRYAAGLSPNTNIFAPADKQTRFKSELPETRVTYHRYDNTGNPLYLSEQGTNYICYLWSYTHLYPIAKITNAEYNLIESILGASNIETFASKAAPTLTEINTFVGTLRNDARLNKAQISTYSYDPLFGMTSATDANGKTTYYEYDHMGRLQLIKDNDLNILKAICYDYAGQRTDCVIKHQVIPVNFGYAATKNEICGIAPNPVQILNVSAYQVIPIPGLDSVTKYYNDSELTTVLPTGYYFNKDESAFGNDFSYFVKGELIYTAQCSNGIIPFVAGYKKSLPATNPCTESGVVKALYTHNQINLAIGVHCFTSALSAQHGYAGDSDAHLPDGYYIYNGNYFHIVNEVVESATSCTPVLPPIQSVRFNGGIDAFYRGTLSIGTILYANSTLTNTLPAGFYLDTNQMTYRVGSTGIINEIYSAE